MNKVELFKILKNLGFKIIKDNTFEELAILSAEQAYDFSAITGAKYLFYQNGITMKGRSEVFIHRGVFSNNHLIYAPGVIGRNLNGEIIEGNSARYLKNKFPIVFQGEKKLIIFDLENESSNIENKIYNKIIENGDNPESYLLYKNFLTNCLGESFQEYLASFYFSKQRIYS